MDRVVPSAELCPLVAPVHRKGREFAGIDLNEEAPPVAIGT